MTADILHPSRHISCVTCSSNIPVLLPENSLFVYCDECNKLISIGGDGRGRPEITKKRPALFKKDRIFPKGTRITLDGLIYLVTGYVIYKESGKTFHWIEHTLFNEKEGFLVLSEFDYNYNLFRPVKPGKDDGLKDGQFVFGEEHYALYNKYLVTIVEISGEFDRDLTLYDQSAAIEYVHPPRMITVQKKKSHETVFFHGTFVSKRAMRKGTGLPIGYANSVGPTNLVFPQFTVRQSLTVYLYFVLALLFTELALDFVRPEVVLLQQNVQFLREESDSTRKELVTPSFHVDQNGSNIRFDMSTNVRNDWYFAGIALVNEQTNEEHYFESGVERYEGVEDGESWSEGKNHTSDNISSVPEGNYHLVIESSLSDSNKPVTVDLTVTQNGHMWSNFIAAAIFGFLFPFYHMLSTQISETRRWENSDYSRNE